MDGRPIASRCAAAEGNRRSKTLWFLSHLDTSTCGPESVAEGFAARPRDSTPFVMPEDLEACFLWPPPPLPLPPLPPETDEDDAETTKESANCSNVTTGAPDDPPLSLPIAARYPTSAPSRTEH